MAKAKVRATGLGLFDQASGIEARVEATRERLGPAALLLRGYGLKGETALLHALDEVIAAAPFRNMSTPGGYRMSVAMSNCGPLGWVTDRKGYRYDRCDPETMRPWPPMPAVFLELAAAAATEAGFPNFVPDACLINRYEPGSQLSLHQDKDEQDFTQPIVSVSLGLPAVFLFGGLHRKDKVQRIPLEHGDVVVWGGDDRLRYHGIAPLKAGVDPLLGDRRVNLTFRKAG